MKTYLMTVLMLVLFAPAMADAQSVPVPLNLPATISANISAGDTSLDLPFAISGADRISFDLIVPLDGATLSLIDPAGAIAMAPGDPRLDFHPGSAQTPPLPGGIYTSAELDAPADGTWILRVSFPPAPVNTALQGTVLARSRYQAGMAIDRTTLLAGEDASIGMVVLNNGQPIAGLAPSIHINGASGVTAADDGQGADGLAGDGVYSIDHTFTSPGAYEITGEVSISTPSGPVQRSATTRVNVIAPLLNARGADLATQAGPSGCVNKLQVTATFDVLQAGSYSTLVRLVAPNGRTKDWRQLAMLGTGPGTVRAVFSAAEVRQALASDGPYRVTRIDTLLAGASELTLAFRKLDAGQFNLNLADLCLPAISLASGLTATPVLRDGYIDALNLAFPVHVATAGFYQISFKLIGKNSEDIQLINASRMLAAGENEVAVSVASPRFLAVDGPYRAISLLVLSGSISARLADMGSTEAYSRWQFHPARQGDFNNDGAVGAADQSILVQYRGSKALTPGDRRDINRDGMIDLLDARALQRLR